MSEPSKFELAYELFKEGGADVEVAALFDLTIAQYYELYEANPGFKRLVDKGRTVSEAYWHRFIRENARNKQVSAPLVSLYMKNKFGWADKTEVKDVNEQDMNADQLRAEFNKVLKDIEKKDPSLVRTLTVVSGGKSAQENI